MQVVSEKEAEKYLGRKVCFKDGQETELENRIAAAWAAFHKHKGELCSKYYKIVDRIRLFRAVVTATVLYGCSAWALTTRMCDTLKIARPKMLRYVFRLHRRKCEGNAEDWVDYMRRSAEQVVELSEKCEMNDWIKQYRKRKWAFAGATARRTDSKWSKKVLDWKPHDGQAKAGPKRDGLTTS